MDESKPNGDPEGRRPARLRATQLGQANRLVRAVISLLDRANLDANPCREILKHIESEEQSSVLRAYGRIEPRRRFKGQAAHPLIDARITNCIYIDESGKSFPQPEHLPQFFALGSVAFPNQEAIDSYIIRANDLKQHFFGTHKMTFHEPIMREYKGPYYFQGDTGKQREFDSALEELIKDSNFLVFGTGLRKRAFQDEFVQTEIDPYLPVDGYAVAITMLLERYVDYLGMTVTPKSMGRVTFESIGPKEDAEHQMDYARILLDGTQWIAASTFRNWLETGLRFVPKNGSHPMELADMVARELFEWIRDGCNSNPKRWHLLSSKIYRRGDGLMGKFGVKVFPDSDIRDEVLAHRRLCESLAEGN